MIKENLQNVLAAIREAEKAGNRDELSVKLLAVSKTKPMALVHEAFAAGQVDFGENRVQELVDKHPQLPEAHWHMIGRLQRNKVKFIAPFIHLIHSVDSERLLAEVSKQALKHNRIIPCLLQVNISDETQKGGFQEVDCKDILQRINDFPGVEIRGLMGMAEFTADEQVVRSQFRRLKSALQDMQELDGERVRMMELSMGMSGDFELAIAEGATMVRIGSSVFGSR